MKIKNILIIITKIILIVFLVVTLNRIFMPKYINENRDGRITQEYYPFSAYADVIFAGSSTVFAAVDPDELWKQYGISSYVRANASQTMCISRYMIEDAIKTRKPELVCLDMTFIKYGDDFIEEPSTRKSLDGMRLSPAKIKCIEASMGEDENMADYIVPLFRFHNRWKELTWDDIRYAWYFKPVTANGYLRETEVVPAEGAELVYTREAAPISPGNIAYLEDTINLCQENGVQIMLFKTPSFSSNWSEDLDLQIEQIADAYNIRYVNFDRYNDDIGLDYSVDTSDGGSHLNAAGAVKFSDYLGKVIEECYGASDRRSDQKYVRKWEKLISCHETEQ